MVKISSRVPSHPGTRSWKVRRSELAATFIRRVAAPVTVIWPPTQTRPEPGATGGFRPIMQMNTTAWFSDSNAPIPSGPGRPGEPAASVFTVGF